MGRNQTFCKEAASSIYKRTLLVWDGWALIPELLIIYSFVTFFSLFVYTLLHGTRFSKPYDHPYSLLSLVLGKGDVWLKEERGIAALHYIHFQRMMFFTALLYLVTSCISLLINLSGNQMGEHIYFQQTTISNLGDNSLLHYYNIVASFLLPWLVLAVVIKFMSNCDMTKKDCSSCQGSSTLVMEGLTRNIPSDSDIKQYYSTVFPKFQLLSINRVHDTRYLRKLMRRLDWILNIIIYIKSRTEVDLGMLSVYEKRKSNLKMKIRKEQDNLRTSKVFLNIVFLTFRSSIEAEKIMIMEDLSSNSITELYSVKQAPCPHDIIWGNMRNPSTTLIISSVNIFFILVVSCLGTFPTAFSCLATRYIEKFTDDWGVGKRVISYFLFHLYAFLMPFKIKIFHVKYGLWSRTEVISTYMTRLFFWLLMTIIIFPVFLLYNIEDIVQFLLEQPLIKNLVAHHEETPDSNLFQCLLVPTSGAFFINFLTMSALSRNQMHLHRIGDILHELWMAITHSCSKAERKAARMLSKSYCMNRNTYDNMALCVNYTWCNLHFSILTCFCLICPLVSPMFLLYLAIKHLVDLQNFRVCYYAKERQPMLIRTAAQLMIFCPLLCQIIEATVQFTNPYQVKNSSLSLTAGILLLVNLFFFLIMQSSGWTFPVKVFLDDCNDVYGESKEIKRRYYRGEMYEDILLLP